MRHGLPRVCRHAERPCGPQRACRRDVPLHGTAMPATMMRSRMAAVMSATMSAVAATSGDRHSRDHEQRGNCGND